jgi:alkaline phosphatase
MRNSRILVLVILISLLTVAPLGSVYSANNAPRVSSTAQEVAVPKNVILMIGDGMGFLHVDAASMYSNGQTGMFLFESFPYQAEMITPSAVADWTDSAASATAMATGVKVADDVLSVAIPGDGADIPTIVEMKNAQGLHTGLVTNADATTATTSAFVAHANSREDYQEIADDILTTGRPNVQLSGGAEEELPRRVVEAAGYTVVEDRDTLLSLDTENVDMVFGLFDDYSMPYEIEGLDSTQPHLSEMTATALNILDNNPNGFFLLVEDEHIDSASHDGEIDAAILEVIEFNNAVRVVYEWAQGRDDTLIIVTADHETGDLHILQNNGQGNIPSVEWWTQDHSTQHVPVYAWGVNAHQVTGVLDNTDIYHLMLGEDIGITAGITIEPAQVTLSESASYSIVLKTQPSEDVYVYPITDGQVTVDFEEILFTTADWNIPRTITIFPTGDSVSNSLISHETYSEQFEYEDMRRPPQVVVNLQ